MHVLEVSAEGRNQKKIPKRPRPAHSPVSSVLYISRDFRLSKDLRDNKLRLRDLRTAKKVCHLNASKTSLLG